MPFLKSSYISFANPKLHEAKQFSKILSKSLDSSLQPRAISGDNPPDDQLSAVSWGDTGFKPGTAGHQSGALPLSHHASQNISYMLEYLLHAGIFGYSLNICYMQE
jgi:hypothetical protein